MKKIIVLLLMAASAFLATGCQSMNAGGAPNASFDIDNDINALAKKFNSSTTIDDYYKLETESLVARNRFISGRLALIDLNYLQYIRALTADKQRLNVAANIADMSLGLAGTLVGGVRAKTNLAAAVTGLNGTKATIDKEIYYEKSLDAIVGSMNAARKELLVGILTGLRTTTLDDYPFEFAVVRLDEYYMAGTIKGALAFITTQAAVKVKASDIEIENIPVRTKTTTEIRDMIGVLHDAVFFPDPTTTSLDQALVALNEDPKKFPSKDAKQTQLKQRIRNLNSLKTIAEKQTEIERFSDVFKASGLMK